MAAGTDGLALFSSVAIAHGANITDIKMKRKKETATIIGLYRTAKHLTKSTEET